jgi:hypothetical protein
MRKRHTKGNLISCGKCSRKAGRIVMHRKEAFAKKTASKFGVQENCKKSMSEYIKALNNSGRVPKIRKPKIEKPICFETLDRMKNLENFKLYYSQRTYAFYNLFGKTYNEENAKLGFSLLRNATFNGQGYLEKDSYPRGCTNFSAHA